MPDPTIIELIELRARGIADIHLQMDKLKDSIGKAIDAQVVYAKTLQDPVYQKNLRQVEQMKLASRDLYKIEQQRTHLGYKQQQSVNNLGNRTRIYEELRLARDTIAAERELQRMRMSAATMRANSPLGMSDAAANLKFRKEQEAAQRATARNELDVAAHRARSFAGLEDGRALAEMRQREDQVKNLQEQNRLAARLEMAGTPAAVRDARLRLDIEQKIGQLRKAEERTMLTARYGQLGGAAMAGLQSRGVGLAGGLAAAGAATVGASAMAGFSDTVEMHTFRTQLMMLNRELAGSFVPVIRNLTAAAQIARFGLEHMTESQQRLLMATTLTIGGLGALNVMLYRMTGTGVLGWAGHIAAGAGRSAASSAAVQVGANVASGAAAGATASWLSRATAWGGRAVAGAGPLAAAALPVAGAIRDYASDNSYYDLYRRAGYNKLSSGFNSTLSSTGEMLGFDHVSYGGNRRDYLDEMGVKNQREIAQREGRMKPIDIFAGLDQYKDQIDPVTGKWSPQKAAEAKRKTVTPTLPTLYSEAGGTYEDVALAVANKAAADAKSGSTLGDVLAYLENRFGKAAPANNPAPM